MSSTDLKLFLQKTGLRPEDIAHETGLGMTTIYRFLRGGKINRVTSRLLSGFVAQKLSQSPQKEAV